ncbi:MAG: glycine--tRNA ligase subunit beta [Candidatus Omnitrophica bacterium]|nr:glycine--tRNA ligase subunit beta [Candidatus Omnitrophota bacterium]
MSNLLLELGIEELPSNCLDVVYNELAAKATEALNKNHIPFKSVRAEATPRRIALFIEGLGVRQADQVLEFSGPAVEKAYDLAGKPTGALAGFLKSKNASEKDIVVKDTPRGKFITLQTHEKGKPVKAVLPAILTGILTSLSFPKNMRWEASNFRYPRPIRWLVVLLDRAVLPVTIAGLKAGKTTYGHRFLGTKPVTILSADWELYSKALKKNHVWINLEDRVNFIRGGLTGRYNQTRVDDDLVHITAQLVEEPFLLEGTFSKSYLDLPAEVLSTCMKKHQKIFSLTDARNRPIGKFVAVMNGARKGLPKVRADFQNVLESRLKDARYFYDADAKEPLETKLPLLEQIVYLGKLGSMRDKTTRLENLAEILARSAGHAGLSVDLKRVARLAKIDLMTHLVYEFPELQGLCGSEYARASGENEAVSRAIGEQYLPKNLADSAAVVKGQLSVLGALYGILDRFDLLTGAFGTGLEPSGSQDPYALRRAGGILIKLIRAFNFQFPLKEMIIASTQQFGNKLTATPTEVTSVLTRFFRDRTAFDLGLQPGTRQAEIFDAVWKAGWSDFSEVFSRFSALTDLYEKDRDAFWKAAKVMERTGNIAKSAPKEAVFTTALLTDPLEKALGKLYQEHSGEIEQALKARDYAAGTRLYGDVFHDSLNAFFKQVMVNVEDSAIRTNRQALLRQIYSIYAARLADLSVLSRIGQE